MRAPIGSFELRGYREHFNRPVRGKPETGRTHRFPDKQTVNRRRVGRPKGRRRNDDKSGISGDHGVTKLHVDQQANTSNEQLSLDEEATLEATKVIKKASSSRSSAVFEVPTHFFDALPAPKTRLFMCFQRHGVPENEKECELGKTRHLVLKVPLM